MESPNSLLNKVMTIRASIKRKIQQKKHQEPPIIQHCF